MPDKVPHFYVKFRSDDLNAFTHGFLRNVARDVFNETAGKYAVEDIYGPKKEEFLNAVRTRISLQVDTIGVKMEQLGFITAPRLPDNVMNALTAKLAATQQAIQAENELRKTQAEAQKAIAKAEGEAKANELLTRSISPALIQWRQLEVSQKAIEKWDAHLPQVLTGSGSGFIFNIPFGAGSASTKFTPVEVPALK